MMMLFALAAVSDHKMMMCTSPEVALISASVKLLATGSLDYISSLCCIHHQTDSLHHHALLNLIILLRPAASMFEQMFEQNQHVYL